MRRVRCRPWFFTAEAVAKIIAGGKEKDDEFGSVKERRKNAQREATDHGHSLHPWKFRGSRRWVSYCAACKKIVIVDDREINFFGRIGCRPCEVRRAS
jgi:hypothetical protein